MKIIVGILLSLFATLALAAPTVTLTVAPTTGVSPVTPTLTWSSTEVASCVASGGWSGTKATSGTETLPAVTASQTYTLTCTAASGSAVLTWVNPTQRTDGTPLTNLAKLNVYRGTTSANLTLTGFVNAPATTYTVTGLPASTQFFAMTAVDAAGIESARTNTVSKPITLASATANAALTVTPAPPNPPTRFAVEVIAGMLQTPVYSVRADNVRSTFVGFADVGKACSGPALFTYRGSTFYEIARANVKLWGSTTMRLAAPCKTG